MSRLWSVLFQTTFWLALGAVVILSLLPVEELPELALSLWDKAQHALGFLGLTVLGALAYPRAHAWRLALGLMACGVAIEFAQSALGWRQGDVLDALADGLGIALGMGVRRWAGPWSLRLQRVG